ncbi:hypothetical protein [Treponema denticola]|uniref:hypothetical protein n=1 Tax=Treponema denticola TaxID=158 RepID=UPI0002B51E9B|nr:hypothetical protein [Treponema denticola]EMB22843.1 hypothetical protein HMPREF9724_01787 [Treponema denticola SP37]EPF32682.1 hypothetical protein HMPREF9734_01998 [Treponema denticola SP44]EPF40778.1 hypothetical protein HMPREF9731_00014 [Treponema denticola SP23]
MAKKKKTKDEVRAELKASNPHFTDEQIDELLKESFDGEDTGSDETSGGAETGDTAALRAELEAERLALEKEKEALALERAELEKEKAKLDKEPTSLSQRLDTAITGEEKEYVCNTACTFDGAYYKAGDILVTSKETSEFFDPV